MTTPPSGWYRDAHMRMCRWCEHNLARHVGEAQQCLFLSTTFTPMTPEQYKTMIDLFVNGWKGNRK